MIRLREEGGVTATSPDRTIYGMYRAVSGVCAAEVWTRARTEVSKVALWLVDPLPAKVLSEVDVERTHAAVLLQVPETQHRNAVNLKRGLTCDRVLQLPEQKDKYQQCPVGRGAAQTSSGRQLSSLALLVPASRQLHPWPREAAPSCSSAPGAGKGLPQVPAQAVLQEATWKSPSSQRLSQKHAVPLLSWPESHSWTPQGAAG